MPSMLQFSDSKYIYPYYLGAFILFIILGLHNRIANVLLIQLLSPAVWLEQILGSYRYTQD